jgi:cell pole-organizing protein PopZ
MEEILASIRRIISDEPHKAAPTSPAQVASTPAAAPAVAAPAPLVDEDDEVMDLTPKPRALEPHFIADDPVDNDVSFEEPAAPKSQDDIDALMADEQPAAVVAPPAPAAAPVVAPAPVAVPMHAAAPAPASMDSHRLLSTETDRATTQAFASLASTILSREARTLEDLMQEMMRPMIKTWLDDNLPTVVERLVKAEIERVSRGGR